MMENIEFTQGEYGIKATVLSTWKTSFLELLLVKDIKELELNDGKGWRGENVDFLKFLPNLKSLIIIDLSIKSIDAIHSLSGLIKLQLLTYSKTAIDFNAFPNLAVCGFEWIKGSESLFECKNLTALGINRYDNISSTSFSKLKHLEKLTIMNSKIENIEGLADLVHLNYLSIVNLKNLRSLKGLENLQELQELEIYKCKGISSVFEVFKLHKLKRLLLLDMGNIESIKGLEKLENLTDFLFYESTNIVDGDISPAMKLDRLSNISFQNRKHYSHKREDFGEMYG